MSNATKSISGIRVGKADVDPSAPSHVPGIHRGNALGSIDRDAGFERDQHGKLRATPRRSTGVAPGDRTPIDPRMPRLSPA